MIIFSTSGFVARLVLVLAVAVLSTFPATAHASSEPVVANSSSATQFSSANLFLGAAVEPLSHAEMTETQGEGRWIIRPPYPYPYPILPVVPGFIHINEPPIIHLY